jgi:hypothetical protein
MRNGMNELINQIIDGYIRIRLVEKIILLID